MTVLHEMSLESSSAFANLASFVESRMALAPDQAAASQFSFETELRGLVTALECEILASDLSRLDVSVPGIVVDGVRYRRKGEAEQTYQTGVGEIRVTRTVYEARGSSDRRTIVPLEMRVGIVKGYWTPRASEVGCAYMAATTSKESRNLLAKAGVMTPSTTSLDRLPKEISDVWEARRDEFEAALRAAEKLPAVADVHTILISIDGVMVPLKDAKRNNRKTEDEPAFGFKEAGCATLTLYADDGKRLETIRLARMPEIQKATLHRQLEAELERLISLYPAARVRAVADGATENWRIIDEIAQSLGVEIDSLIDYYHATEYLAEALDAYHHGDKEAAALEVAFWCGRLKDDPSGVEKLIRALDYRAKRARGKDRRTIKKASRYFRNHRHMMDYAAFSAEHQPIGSGVQEAACKTIVTQRMKRSGMAWRHPGGQAILILRCLEQSNRWNEAWCLLRTAHVRTYEIDRDTSRKRPAPTPSVFPVRLADAA